MMPPFSFAQLATALNAFQANMAQAQAGALDEGVRQQLAHFATSMQHLQGQLLTSGPSTLARMRQEAESLQSQARATADQADQMGKQLAARAEAEEPAAAEKPLLDPNRGMELRSELLQRFGTRAGPAPSTVPSQPLDPQLLAFLKRRGLVKESALPEDDYEL